MGLKHAYRVACVLAATGLAAAACAGPSYTYLADSGDQVYFKVPPA